jgi:hypothetical protein
LVEIQGAVGIEDDCISAHWMPDESMWLAFHHYARLKTASFIQYESCISVVCNYGQARYKEYAQVCGPSVDASVCSDPRRVAYPDSNKKMRALLARQQYGKQVKQVPFITMSEARSAHRFADTQCVQGLQDGAIWNWSCTSGGRRARTLRSVQLKDVVVVVEEVDVNGVPSGLSQAFSTLLTMRSIWTSVAQEA